jgi:putative FmdB family regulatory protein
MRTRAGIPARVLKMLAPASSSVKRRERKTWLPRSWAEDLCGPLECYLLRRLAMPIYDFVCGKCKKKFSLTLSISEYEKTKTRCPKCKSADVRRQISSFQTITSKKS